jgi:GTPase Era involved in 16S rRNA processing
MAGGDMGPLPFELGQGSIGTLAASQASHPPFRASILVDRPGQKKIVVGHQGQMIKAIGTAARLDWSSTSSAAST